MDNSTHLEIVTDDENVFIVRNGIKLLRIEPLGINRKFPLKELLNMVDARNAEIQNAAIDAGKILEFDPAQ